MIVLEIQALEALAYRGHGAGLVVSGRLVIQRARVRYQLLLPNLFVQSKNLLHYVCTVTSSQKSQVDYEIINVNSEQKQTYIRCSNGTKIFNYIGLLPASSWS